MSASAFEGFLSTPRMLALFEPASVVQAMMDYDEAFLKWRFTHMRLAFRIIGSKVLSLRCNGFSTTSAMISENGLP